MKKRVCLLMVLFCAFHIPKGYPENGLETVKIGWIGPLSGRSAVVGVDSLNALKMVFEEVNRRGGIGGVKIKLIPEDDRYDTQRFLTAYKKLTALNGVRIIISPTYGGVTASASQAKREGVLVIDPLDCNEEIAELPENTLCLAAYNESIADAMIKGMKIEGISHAAVLYEEDDPFMVYIKEVLKKQFADSGIKGFFISTLGSQGDYRTSLLRVKASGSSGVVFLGNDSMGFALRQARSLGIKGRFFSIGTMTSPGFQALAAGAAEGTLVSAWEAKKSEHYKAFISRFRSRYGRAPHLELSTLPSFDLGNILVEAIEKSLEGERKELNWGRVKGYLYNLKNYQGASGAVSFDPDGAVRSLKEELFVYSGGSLRQFKDTPDRVMARY